MSSCTMQKRAEGPGFEGRTGSYDAARQSGDGFARSHYDSSHLVIGDVGEENHGYTRMWRGKRDLLHHHHTDEDGACIVEREDGVNNLEVSQRREENNCRRVIELGDRRVEKTRNSIEEATGPEERFVEKEFSQVGDDEDYMPCHHLPVPMSNCVGAVALVMLENPTLSSPKPPMAWELVTATV